MTAPSLWRISPLGPLPAHEFMRQQTRLPEIRHRSEGPGQGAGLPTRLAVVGGQRDLRPRPFGMPFIVNRRRAA
jgi:hypothetical protein